jgi:hypothetical protein
MDTTVKDIAPATIDSLSDTAAYEWNFFPVML